jgi:hypothetical protein
MVTSETAHHSQRSSDNGSSEYDRHVIIEAEKDGVDVEKSLSLHNDDSPEYASGLRLFLIMLTVLTSTSL